jgi:multiple antibiotic resistance protein
MIGLAFSFVGPITRLLGTAGISVVTKFMGLILLAIAMGMLANGAKGLLPGLAG